MTPVHVRLMIARDLPDVLKIEARSFRDPWDEVRFRGYLSQRSIIGMVAEDANCKILGFMLYDITDNKQLHVITMAVHPEYRRAGVGSCMADKLKSKLMAHRRTSVVMEIREGNLGAQMFFRSVGFKAVEVQRGCYEDTGEDAYVFCYKIKELVEA